MRLAIVVNSFPVVSETFIFNKVMGLRNAGLDVTVVAHDLRNDLPLFEERFGGRRVDFVDYSLSAGGRNSLALAVGNIWLRKPRTALLLWREAQELYGRTRQAFKAWVLALPLRLGSYDLIHFEYSGLAVSYLDALPLLGEAKLMTSCRGTAERITPLIKQERGENLRQVFSRMDLVHCVSADLLRTAESYGLTREKAFINHPAIDPQLFRRRRPYFDRTRGPYLLLSTGRLHWNKGHEYALLAVRALLDQGYDINYEIIGGGPEEEKLRFTISDLALTKQVRLLGQQSAAFVRQRLEAADVFLLPSLSEGLNNSALEAMAMEIPVVSTRVGGMSEAINDRVDGFLVPPRDSLEMAERTMILLDDFDLRKEMGQEGRRHVEEHFTLARQMSCFIEKYKGLSD